MSAWSNISTASVGEELERQWNRKSRRVIVENYEVPEPIQSPAEIVAANQKQKLAAEDESYIAAMRRVGVALESKAPHITDLTKPVCIGVHLGVISQEVFKRLGKALAQKGWQLRQARYRETEYEVYYEPPPEAA